MVKKISAVFLVVLVLCLSLAAPYSALVIDSFNYDEYKANAIWELYNTSLVHSMVSPLPFGQGMFTNNPRISYNNSGYNVVDQNGYTVWVFVPSDEYNNTIDFGVLFGSDVLTGNYPTFYLDQTLDVGNYKVLYKYFSFAEYADIFSNSVLPDVFNIFIGSGITGLYTNVYWGFSVGSRWLDFVNLIENLASYENGADYGAEVRDNFITMAEPALEYYYQGAWHQIAVDFPADLSEYVTHDAVYLNLLQNIGLTAQDIPANNGGVRLTFTLQRPISVSGYRFGVYNPDNIIRRWDPADVRSERFGVWFRNSDQNYTLYPTGVSDEDGAQYWFTYIPYANRVYNEVSIEINYQVLINVINTSQSINDYVEYQLIDYNEPFDAGYGQGFQDGKAEGEKIGELNGYQDGYREGLEMAEKGDFTSLITTLVDVPISAFYGLLNFDLLGFKMSSFVLSILSLVLIIIVLKKVIL